VDRYSFDVERSHLLLHAGLSRRHRNWIDHGTRAAVRVGRAFRVRQQDVDALLERPAADSTSLATRRS
jgi:excisionase family DNA binding protein